MSPDDARRAAMTRKPSARLTDVASIAGVSLSTASRALADPRLVHPDTRRKVDDAARMLGYVPHGAARALASRRSRTIGAVVPTLDNPIFAHSTQALQRTLGEAGFTLLLGSHDYDAQTEFKVTRALVERGVDGLVLVGMDHSAELYQFLARSGVPFELTWAIDPDRHHHCVGFSNRLASIRMTQHLLALGHREIAVISGYTAHNDRARERVAGVREALAAHRLELRDHRYIETAFSMSSGRAALSALLRRDHALTAVVCGNDLLAFGALLECAARGVAVPRQISVAGFDDIELAAEVSPPLTTLHIPTVDIGRRAAERLLARLSGKRIARVEEVPVDLVVRGSTGRVPGGDRTHSASGSGRSGARTGRPQKARCP
ncbi:MAG: LacI family DNA-binding transcriptional regulator [Pseudomonadota bacterium]|nr:LacI family DNA-binding transcriptional regulator [Pseudomonadota bacterium]